jgi:hypothetical protein
MPEKPDLDYLATWLEKQLKDQGIGLKDCAKKVSPKHPDVALRKLKYFLQGNYNEGIARALANILGISFENFKQQIQPFQDKIHASLLKLNSMEQDKIFVPHIEVLQDTQKRTMSVSISALIGESHYKKITISESHLKELSIPEKIQVAQKALQISMYNNRNMHSHEGPYGPILGYFFFWNYQKGVYLDLNGSPDFSVTRKMIPQAHAFVTIK